MSSGVAGGSWITVCFGNDAMAGEFLGGLTQAGWERKLIIHPALVCGIRISKQILHSVRSRVERRGWAGEAKQAKTMSKRDVPFAYWEKDMTEGWKMLRMQRRYKEKDREGKFMWAESWFSFFVPWFGIYSAIKLSFMQFTPAMPAYVHIYDNAAIVCSLIFKP